ncbi:Lysine methyltransferase [Gracilaria domingensis]|nr:Lysine methyltransferase [Gracilaria domingensis]
MRPGQTPNRLHHEELKKATSLFGKAFRAGVPLRRIFDQTQALYGDIAWKTAFAQRVLLQETVLYQSQLTQSIHDFCFGHSRCARFFRLLMDEVDRCSMGDVDESVVEFAAQYCMHKQYAHTDVHVVHDMPDGQEIVVVVSGRFSDLGARVWEAGLTLCYQLLDVRSSIRRDVNGATVLELGAGTGLSGSAYINAGAKRVFLTDYKQEMVEGIRKNLRNNNVPDVVQAALLDANDLPKLRKFIVDFDIDVVIAADVTYDLDLIEVMVRAFSDSISERRAGYLLATERNPKTTFFLQDQLLQTGIAVEEMVASDARNFLGYLLGSMSCKISTLKLTRSSDQR